MEKITDWRRLAFEIKPRVRLREPATDAEIAWAEQAVGVQFPADLRRLFGQTNGVWDDTRMGPILSLTGPDPPDPHIDPYGTGLVKQI